MKVKIIKDHHHYSLGEHEVEEGRGIYLIQTGIAEEVKEKAKEKAENKTGNVPTAKKHK